MVITVSAYTFESIFYCVGEFKWMIKKGYCLETGTNEFEIVEFNVGKVNYGINVAKVREVINLVPITKMPQAHPYVDGLFTLRGKSYAN